MDEPIIRGYGRVASSDNSPAVDRDTVFLLASVSKVFAGTAVMKLLDLGVISSLDDDICDVTAAATDIPQGMACRNPFYPDIPVTWRMLLTHRSSLKASIPTFPSNNEYGYLEAGYAPTGGYFGLAAGQTQCPLEDVTGFYRDILVDKPTETTVGSNLGVQWYQLAQREMNGMWQQNAPPGERNVYSNFAVGFIAALVEWATSQSFPDFCQEHIFTPLNMTKTAWFRRDLPEGVREAVPVETANRRGTKWNDIGHYCFIDYASGSLRSTAMDLSKFLDSMLDYGVPALWSNPLLGKEALSCLETKNDATCEFGANWILLSSENADEEWLDPYRRYDWTNAAHHDGAEAGSQTQILLLPEADVYAVVLTNTDGNDEYAAQNIASELLYEISEGAKSLSQKWLRSTSFLGMAATVYLML